MLISLSEVWLSIYSAFPSMAGWLYVDLLRFVVLLVVVSPLALSMVIVDMYGVPLDFSVGEFLTMDCVVFECVCVECRYCFPACC